MVVKSWFRAILSGLFGLLLGVVVAAVVNLLSPVGSLSTALVLACLPAFVAAILGFILGNRQKKAA